jgi:hypothetical protein
MKNFVNMWFFQNTCYISQNKVQLELERSTMSKQYGILSIIFLLFFQYMFLQIKHKSLNKTNHGV